MGRKCITSDEAVHVDVQPTRPCSDCPWARDALPGWLGGWSADEWLEVAHGDAIEMCHAMIGPQCAGMAVYRANVAKRSRDPEALVLPPNRTLVFSTPDEFVQHHGKEND